MVRNKLSGNLPFYSQEINRTITHRHTRTHTLYGCCTDAVWMLYGCCMDAAWMLYTCGLDAVWMLYGCCMGMDAVYSTRMEKKRS